jgi:hypothetical protein
VARPGLRMMPASPPLPLKFRRADFSATASRPEYQTGPSRRLRGLRVVRFTPVLCALSCLVLFLVLSRGTGRVGAPPFERCARSAPGALVPIRVILSRSTITYSAPSAPLAGTTRFRRRAACTGCRRCVSVLLSPTPRQPTSGSVLSLAVLCRHVVLWDPGKFLGCYHPRRCSTPPKVLIYFS